MTDAQKLTIQISKLRAKINRMPEIRSDDPECRSQTGRAFGPGACR